MRVVAQARWVLQGNVVLRRCAHQMPWSSREAASADALQMAPKSRDDVARLELLPRQHSHFSSAVYGVIVSSVFD